MNDQNTKIQTTLTNDLYNKSPERIGGARWYSSSLTLIDFSRHVLHGRAFAVGVYRDNQRKASNFVSSQLIGLDFDGGNHTLEALKNHPIIGRAFFIYASPSWREDCKKWRAVFALDKAITNAGRYVDLVKRLLHTIAHDLDGLDLVAKDGARLFFGHDIQDRPDLYHVDDTARLSVAYLDNLPSAQLISAERPASRPKNPVNPDKPLLNMPLSGLSSFQIPPALKPAYDDFCKLATGRNNALFNLCVQFRDLGVKPDLAYSALHAGAVSNGYMAKDGVNAFNSTFTSAYSVLPRVSKKRAKNAGVISLWGVNNTPYDDDFETITTYTENLRYVSDMPQSTLDLIGATDTVFIKSPTGTGKTELAKRLIAHHEGLLGRAPRVLYLLHRVSLVRNSARRLNLPLYTDDLDPDGSVVSTVDSAPKITRNARPFDLIIIDEAGQVAQHLAMSSTLGGKDRVTAHNVIKDHLRRAGRVVCMDATFTDLQARALTAMMPTRRKPLRYKNEYKPKERPLDVIFDEGAMMMKVIEDAKQGFTALACVHKRQAYIAEKLAKNAGLRVLCVTADNGDNSDIKAQIENINTLEVDLLIFSPTLGTGYDITRPAVAMYLWGATRPLTGGDMVQMLSRCRNAGRYAVCGVRLFGDKPAVISENALLADTLANAREIGAELDDRIHLTQLYARLQSERLNALSDPRNFVTNALQQGFTARDGYTNEDENGRELVKNASVDFSVWCKVQRLTLAPLDDEELDLLRRAGKMTIEARLSNERYHIEKTAGVVISEQVHDTLKSIDQRRALNRFIDLQFGDDETEITPAYLERAYQDMTNRRLQRALIRGVLNVLGAYDLNTLETAINGAKDEILTPAVVAYLKDNARAIRRAFGRYRQTDNPMTELRALLRGAGIILRAKTQRRGAERVQVYAIDGGALAFWRALALSGYKARCQRIADKKPILQNVDGKTDKPKPTNKPRQMTMIRPSYQTMTG